MTIADLRTPTLRPPSGRLAAPARAPWLYVGRIPLAVQIFLASVVWPAGFAVTLGGLYLPVYRIALLLLLPFAALELFRAQIKFKAPDYLIVAFALLQVVSLTIQHGFTDTFIAISVSAIARTNTLINSGTTIVETLGPYLLARAYIKNRSDLAATARLLIYVTIGIGAFTLVETLTGFSVFGGVTGFGLIRFGLHRAAGPFPHPILWGLFAASTFAFALSKDVISGRLAPQIYVAAAILLAVGTSVSSAAFAAVVLQAALLLWFHYSAQLKYRGWYFSGAAVATYLFIAIFSNRTPMQVIFSYAALDSWTGFYRTLIWRFGWEDFLASPVTGIGYHDWARPRWMTSSIDAFWLVILLRYGLLAVGPLIAGIWTSLRRAALAVPAAAGKSGLDLVYFWLASLASLLIGGFTVHFWQQSYVLLFFLIGFWGAFDGNSKPPRAQRLPAA